MLRFLCKTVENKAKYFIGKTQFIFRKGSATRKTISVMRLLSERRLEFVEELCIFFEKKLLIELSGQSFSKYSKRLE